MGQIVFKNLTVGYKNKTVLRDINMEMVPGRLYCLLGANGTGKSTLLKTIGGLLPKLSGSLLIGQHDVAEMKRSTLAHTVSVVLTKRPEVKNMTAEEVVRMGRVPYTGFWGMLSAADKAVVDNALHRTGAWELRERMIQTLSDGELQKVMIAKALAQETQIMVLDEPTSFLDYRNKVNIMRLLRQFAEKENKTIVLSTHDQELAVTFAHTLIEVGENGIRQVSKEQIMAAMAAIIKD